MVADRQRFAEAAAAPAAAGRLAEAALCMAAEGDASVDVDTELAALGALAAQCPDDLAGLREHLFDRLGFEGDTRRYYDPRNSYLHEVVRRRRGIPISLSVLAMEVGRLVGVPLVGIGLPSHFLARSAEDPSAYLDAFSGRLLSLDGVRGLFSSISGGLELDPDWLDPVDHPTILRRMLNNLRQVFARSLDDEAVLWTLDLDLLLIHPPPGLRLARAACLARLFRVDEAAVEFESLAVEAADAGDDATAVMRLQQARGVRALLQ